MDNHRPKMKFKVIDGEIYSPADDLLNPEAIEEMLDHYFVVQDQVKLLERKLEIAVETLEKIKSVTGSSTLQWKLADEALEKLNHDGEA